MCLIVLSWKQHKDFRLLLAANRDEFHKRPAAAANYWHDRPAVLAGRDLEAGGTWLGISTGGRFAAITNLRDPEAMGRKAPRSRGDLTTEFLDGSMDAASYLDEVSARADQYLGFNLIVSDGPSLWYLHGDGHARPRELEAGLYGLSNAALDVPWPKVVLARRRLDELVAASAPGHEALRHCTADRALADADQLTDQHLEGDMARTLSAQFIVTPTYGTRCMTTLRMGTDESWDFEEQRFDADGVLVGKERFSAGV